MKQIIRKGVFETNSSSTHAVSICRKRRAEEWRDEAQISDEQKEIRTAYEKMLFVWNYVCIYYRSDECFYDGRLKNYSIKPETKAILDEYRRVFFEELSLIQEFDIDEANRLMDDCMMYANDHPLCCRFFEENSLTFCTCKLTLKKMVDFLHTKKTLNTEEGKRRLARKLFSENIYFVIKETNYYRYNEKKKIF